MLNLLLSKYKAYLYLAVVAAIFFAGVGSGVKLSDGKIAKLKLAHAEEIYDREQTLNEIERQANEELKRKQDQIDSANTQFAEEMKNAQTKINQLNSDLASNKRVLTSKVKACVSTSKTDNSGAVTTETRAELDSETARSLVGITSRCDQITSQLNALIDAVSNSAF